MILATSCLAALCAAAAAPQPKPSEVVGVLAVSPPPGPGPELVDLTGKLRDELAKRLEGVLGARDLKDRMTSEQAVASLSDLDRAYTSAVDGAKRDPALAISWLRDIIGELERHTGGPKVYEQWTRAHLRLARMRLEYAPSPEEGESGAREARVLAERAVRLQPELKLDPSLFPKRLITLVEEARAALAKAPARKLQVKSPVEGTRVFVDGKEVGVAPVTLSVPAGAYRVSGMQGALRAPATLVDLRDGDAAASLDFSLSTTFRPAQGPGIAASDADQESKILRSASVLGLDRVVTTSLVEQRNTYVFASMTPVKDGAAQPRQAWLRLSPNGLTPDVAPQLAEYLVTGLAKGNVTATAPDGDKASFATSAGLDLKAPAAANEEALHADLDLEPRMSGSPVLKWSPVVGVGVAVVLGAIAITEVAIANVRYGDANAMQSNVTYTPELGQTYNQFSADAASARNAGIYLGVGAGVSLAASAVLGYLSFRQSHEIGPFRF